MKAASVMGGLLLTIMGLVWTLQGLCSAYVPTSLMTNAPQWILTGLVTAAAGVAVVVKTIRKP